MEELEKELTVRIFLHKVAIIKSTLANAYMLKEKKKVVVLKNHQNQVHYRSFLINQGYK